VGETPRSRQKTYCRRSKRNRTPRSVEIFNEKATGSIRVIEIK